MAVKTVFTESDFNKILSGYPLGGLTGFEPISSGTVQTNYLIQTAKEKIVFRYYENRSYESVAFEIELIRYLLSKSYPCPAPYTDRSGRYIGEYRGKPFVLFEFIEGEHLSSPDEAQLKQLIQKVAELHKITQNYRPAMLEARLNYSAAQCERLAGEKAEKIGTPNARKKLAWYLDAIHRLNLPDSLPMGICHCDFHFSNVLYSGGRFKALIDFDDANYTYLIFDLVCLINPFKAAFEWDTWDQFSPDENVFDFSAARKIVLEYSRHRPLEECERQSLFDVMKLSILIDCLWYFERGDAADFYEKRKIEFLDRFGRDAFYWELF